MPYYLLIVADPETIPFSFQYLLDVQYAVGRIHFETVGEYARYARSVVEAETRPSRLPRRAVFFGAKNPDDRTTAMTADHLIGPLADWLKVSKPQWDVRTVMGESATKSKLGQLLGGDETPSLIFTACHGMAWPNGHEMQLANQGALLCQDWPGSTWGKAIPPEFFFAASDVPDEAQVSGLISFFWSCFSAGVPRLDEYTMNSWETANAKELAPRSFLTRLPERLLGHPRGGALAVIGRVDRCWNYSFMEGGVGRNIGVFANALRRLIEGCPVGFAMEDFNRRYVELASEFVGVLQEQELGAVRDNMEITKLKTSLRDAKNYLIIGDPAVRLSAAGGEEGRSSGESFAAFLNRRPESVPDRWPLFSL
ncbi:MAG: C25 family cysteine peptidase [Isosphaerales bacterium]